MLVEPLPIPNTKGTANYVVASSQIPRQIANHADYVCDGTDDHVEIQKAIDALPNTGGKIYLLPGVYTINKTIEIPDTKKGVSIIGSGNSFGSTHKCGTVLQCKLGNTFDGYAMLKSLAQFSEIRGIGFDARNVKSASPGTPYISCLEFLNRDSYIVDCSFYQALIGALLDGGNIWVERCFLEQSAYGVLINNDDCYWIVNNIFWNSNQPGNAGPGVDIRIRYGTLTEHLYILGNRAAGSKYFLRVDQPLVELLMANNVTFDITDAIIYQQYSSGDITRASLIGNVFRGNNVTDYLINGVAGATITDLTLVGNIVTDLVSGYFGTNTSITWAGNTIVVPSGATPPTPSINGAMYLEATGNGILKCYSNGAWRQVAAW